MTDIMFTRTALTETAKEAGVTVAQARTILERTGVKVEPEKPDLPTEPGSVIIATEVRGKRGRWRAFQNAGGQWVTSEYVAGYAWHRPEHITAWTPACVVPDGEPIDVGDVEAGDRVRVELAGGEKVELTVERVTNYHIISEYITLPLQNIRTVHLLHREEA